MDFSDALAAKLAKNQEITEARQQAEVEFERIEREAEEAKAKEAEDRRAHHGALAAHLKDLADKLKAAQPDRFIVRTGWTESGEEFIAKLTTRQTTPKRSLFVEVDRDDDKVLARWTTEVGNTVEIWRLHEVSETMLSAMVLQVADNAVWQAGRPPAFPGD